MSVPAFFRMGFTVAEAPTIAMRFMARPEEVALIEARIRSHVDLARVRFEVAAEAREATSAAAMVGALVGSLPSADVSLAESVHRDQLANVALKLDFCVAMARDVGGATPQVGEVLVRFQRVANGVAGAEETHCVAMTDPAADQDTDALVGLFTRTLGDVLVTHNHAARLVVTQRAVPETVGAADEAVTRLLRGLDAAGLATYADQVQAAFPEGGVAVAVEGALAA